MFQRINNRLSFFFPRNAFVFLDTGLSMNDVRQSDFRWELDGLLEQAGLELAFPPDVTEKFNMSEDGVVFWEYHFPGLRKLHPRKQRIFLHQIVHGFDLGLAASLIARKLGLDPQAGNHLLFFDQDGHTWHAGNLRDLGEAVNLMKYIAQGRIPAPWLRIDNNDSTPLAQEPDGVFVQKSLSLFRDGDNPEEFEYNERLLESLEGGMRRFLQEQEQVEQQDLRSDPEVLRTLAAIRHTETEVGFFKIMAMMLNNAALDRQQQEALNPVLGMFLPPPEGSFWDVQLRPVQLCVYFPQLWLNVKLQPLQYATYQLFLSHPEGIRLKERQLFKDELYAHYRAVKGTDQPGLLRDQVEKLMDPRNDDAINQCLSNIKKRFQRHMGEEVVSPYIIRRESRNGPHRIACAVDYRPQIGLV